MPQKLGDVARLASPQVQGSSSPRCFRFWYSMTGSTIGTVSVDLEVNSIRATAWRLSGNQDSAWQYGTIPIPPIEGGFKV